MADTTIPDNALTTIVDALDRANARVAAQFPGASPAQQPVHTVYGGAHHFKADAAAFSSALGLDASVAHRPARYRPPGASFGR